MKQLSVFFFLSAFLLFFCFTQYSFCGCFDLDILLTLYGFGSRVQDDQSHFDEMEQITKKAIKELAKNLHNKKITEPEFQEQICLLYLESTLPEDRLERVFPGLGLKFINQQDTNKN